MPDDISPLTEAAREHGAARARVSQWLRAGRVPSEREERVAHEPGADGGAAMTADLLTPAQAAAALGVSVKRVYQLIAAGRLGAERETVAVERIAGVRAAELARFAALDRPARRPTKAEVAARGAGS